MLTWITHFKWKWIIQLFSSDSLSIHVGTLQSSWKGREKSLLLANIIIVLQMVSTPNRYLCIYIYVATINLCRSMCADHFNTEIGECIIITQFTCPCNWKRRANGHLLQSTLDFPNIRRHSYSSGGWEQEVYLPCPNSSKLQIFIAAWSVSPSARR